MLPPTKPDPLQRQSAVGAAVRGALHLAPGAPLLKPLSLIAGALAVLAGGYAAAAGWLAPARLTPALIVSALNTAGGTHAGFRRNHAKGECVAGYFDGNGRASGLSSAAVFGMTRTPVLGRFAIPGANPAAPDFGTPVRSMALLFQLPHGEQWRTGMNNTGVFVVRTPQSFYAQQVASAPDPATGKPNPARLKAFFASHPETAPFLQWVKQHPPSSALANGTYHSLNAFQLVAPDGSRRFARWAMVPEQPYAALAKPAPRDPNFLAADLHQQLQHGPLRWHLVLTLAEPGDVTDDATLAWPATRSTVDAGTLTLTSTVPQADGACRDVNFDPTVLPRGIAVSADPLLAARASAYSNSFNRRTREEARAGTPSVPMSAAVPVAASGSSPSPTIPGAAQ